MPVKFNQYWTIISERREEYGNFIIKEFIPGINSLGIHVVAGWSVLVGSYSEMIVESMSNDLELIEKALKNPKFKELQDNLLTYVKAYKTKVLVPAGSKDSYTTDIKEDTIKFNQMWDVVSKTKDEYENYVLNEYYPLLEESNIAVAGEWQVLIGDGPHIICEGRVRDTEKLIKTIQSKKFRRARRKLKGFVENFECRILSFHIQKVKGYKSSSYHMLEI
jgi:hypothetical protein